MPEKIIETKPSTKNKPTLIASIQSLLQNNKVGTQEAICAALEKKGFSVNQAMVSRLLNKMGAIKINEGNQTVYRLATETMPVTSNDSLKHWVLNIAHNESLIVIHTSPGSAQMIARLLDQEKTSGILGTVAGDDTIFIAPQKISQLPELFEKVYELLLG